MRPLLLLVAVVLPVFASEPLDRTVRYVNNDVVTLGDVLLRDAIRADDFRRRSKPLPAGREERERFSRDSLEEISDDILLTQYAKTQGITPDHDAVVLEVLNEAKRSGLGLSLRDQAERRRHLERKRTIDILTWRFDGLAPQVRPLDLQDIYRTKTELFHRPTQVRLLQILVRPTPPIEEAELRSLLRRAQDATDPGIRQMVDARLTAYLAADAAGQRVALEALVRDLCAVTPADRGEADRALLAQAAALGERQAKSRDRTAVERLLEAIRLSLIGATVPGQASQAQLAMFRTLARTYSQGPSAAAGGELGEIESGGGFTAEFDRQAFALAPGEVSPVFWTKDAANLVLCASRTEAVTRSFSEVSGEIERRFLDNRLVQTRKRLAAMLRAKATIRDLPGWTAQP